MTHLDAIQVWVDRWRGLKSWGRPLEEVTVEMRNPKARGCSTGVCYGTLRRISITPGLDMPLALKTVLHEYAHAAVPADEGHGERWQICFSNAVKEVTGVLIPVPVENYHVDLSYGAAADAVRSWWKTSGNAKLYRLATCGPQIGGK